MSKEPINVALKIKPLSHQDQHCIQVDSNKKKILLNNNLKMKAFEFGQIFDGHTSQQMLYQQFVEGLVEDFLKGYSCSLLCYGQNYSGKTATLIGNSSQEGKGMLLRMFNHIFQVISSNKHIKYQLEISYIEINRETVVDLLTINKNIRIDILENALTKDFQLKNVVRKSIAETDQLQSCLIQGNNKRKYAYAKNTRNPAESHVMLTLYLESIEEINERLVFKKSKFHVCSIQAENSHSFIQVSQNVDSASQIKIKYDISKHAFANILHGLAHGNKSTIIPYHDSKLTKLLRNSLGGNTKTNILIHLSPVFQSYQSSLQILRLAKLAAMVENSPSNMEEPEYIMTIAKHLQLTCQIDQEIQKIDDQIKILRIQQRIQKQIQGEDQNEFLEKSSQSGEEDQKNVEQIVGLIDQLRRRRKVLKNKKQEIPHIINMIAGEKQGVPLAQKNHQINYCQEKGHIHSQVQVNQSKIDDDLHLNYDELQSKKVIQHFQERDRIAKQEIMDLHGEFQQERQALLETLRHFEQKANFYQQVCWKVLNKEEIMLLKANAKYDPTKRQYQIPKFLIKDKKISQNTDKKWQSPLAKIVYRKNASLSERKFMVNLPSQTRCVERQIQIDCEEKKANVLTQTESIQHKAKTKLQSPNKSYYFHHLKFNKAMGEKRKEIAETNPYIQPKNNSFFYRELSKPAQGRNISRQSQSIENQYDLQYHKKVINSKAATTRGNFGLIEKKCAANKKVKNLRAVNFSASRKSID